jgi:hypothetical protein
MVRAPRDLVREVVPGPGGNPVRFRHSGTIVDELSTSIEIAFVQLELGQAVQGTGLDVGDLVSELKNALKMTARARHLP